MLDVGLDGRVLRLQLNRPEKRNALNGALCRALADAFEEGDRNPGVGAILLTASGPAFCSGMDLSETETNLEQLHEGLFTIVRKVTTPILAAVQGAALAGGMGLAANAHIAIATEDATFGLTEIRVGLWPLLVFRAVTAAIGERRAVELAITGRIIDAREALTMGLIREVTAPNQLNSTAVQAAQAVANSSAETMARGLRFVNETRRRNWEEAGAIAQQTRREIFATPDFAEGVRAFREKRRPDWPSHRG
jgi:enoyl-CoA hydratase/carnithine racemase